MDKKKISNNLKKILGEKKLSNLISICLVLAFIFVTMNVLLPKNKYINKSNDITYKEDKKESPKENEVSTSTTISGDQKTYEENQKVELKNILKKMEGVGEVDVMISFESGEEKIPAYDTNAQVSTTEETDTEGGKRTNNQKNDGATVVMTSKDGGNEPFILRTYKPKITGAVVVAEGAENSKTKYNIEQAISKLYNLTLDKVNVYPMKK
ncbi:stage III sporulation protein AG [Clostridium botulinum]|uniref:Stage III sporulation protein AG n=1 Tax=Clostridium botulinum (strain Eklund 17B / Type B) TaxID=935198 RepID=B2TRN9_CLOBB|nr:stage III sporulation protein AG [Clostridium botulinum B str. Eklund 17B (NRP)]MBY6975929.1 stage III sporulation protein AG [Clostridium botulinum]MBY7000352.1 stage III sporulation protein AG [Clostridium botulinum]MCR1273112.1 stage III sporulation protein AG [Clostridium botulinum]NFD70213.1 stage III sporulation protein AG [Clostridium botulinum]